MVTKFGLALAVLAGVLLPCLPAEAGQPAATDAPVPNDAAAQSAVNAWLANWAARAGAARASQPKWMTPLVTVTPRLEQEIRYDQISEHTAAGAHINLYDGGKGLELIPSTTNEIILNVPSYETRGGKSPASGLTDWGFLLVKQRLLSATEQNGNYILTAFLGVQAPTGLDAFTNHAWVVTPTIAGGKGWGNFDIQATVGAPLPTDHEHTIGVSLVTNVAFQYHFARYFWPEVEVNWTHWFSGLRGGLDQVFITPGLIVGRFALGHGLSLSAGAGYQIAVSSLHRVPALTPTYTNAIIGTVRVAF